MQFESAVDASSRLATELERRLYRVVKGTEGAYQLHEVDETTPLSTKELYLDEVTVTPNNLTLRYALLEVPLPPGASVDSTTWGINFKGAEDKLEGLERARHEPTRLDMRCPSMACRAPLRLRHLVRFAQRAHSRCHARGCIACISRRRGRPRLARPRGVWRCDEAALPIGTAAVLVSLLAPLLANAAAEPSAATSEAASAATPTRGDLTLAWLRDGRVEVRGRRRDAGADTDTARQRVEAVRLCLCDRTRRDDAAVSMRAHARP